ncbi:MAG: S-layer protein, partial [Candidatus Aenigmarchaeota archaeon]|nr:S-layer protein [Candidatus Aenigmarchaeota archaeon]
TVGDVEYVVVTSDSTTATSATIGVSLGIQTGAATAITSPAILVVQEEDEANEENDLIITANGDATDMNIGTDVIGVAEVSTDDSDIEQGVTTYGTFVEVDSNDQNKVTLSYPDDQMNVVVGVGADPSFDGTGVSATGTVVSVDLGIGIAKLASEAEADKSVKNLVLMGGPYANALVEELAVAGKTPTKAQWGDLTGKAIIQAIDGAFVDGKAAIVVAGSDAEQTRSAALKLMAGGLTGGMVEVQDGTVTATTYTPEVAEEVVEEPVAPVNETA